MEVVEADANADHAQACAASRVPDDDDTDAGQEPHRGTPPMLLPMPMLAMCRIDGRRRPRRDDDDVADHYESGSFSPGDRGLPSAPGFSAIHQLTGEQPVDAGRGICEGRCWGSTPRFSSFLCARLRTTFRRAQPRIRLHPPPLARIDENPPLDPGSD